MKITRSKEFTVNMGNYESLKFGASVELDEDTFTIPEEIDALDYLIAMSDQYLMRILSSEIKSASELTEIRNSYIHTISEDANAERLAEN